MHNQFKLFWRWIACVICTKFYLNYSLEISHDDGLHSRSEAGIGQMILRDCDALQSVLSTLTSASWLDRAIFLISLGNASLVLRISRKSAFSFRINFLRSWSSKMAAFVATSTVLRLSLVVHGHYELRRTSTPTDVATITGKDRKDCQQCKEKPEARTALELTGIGEPGKTREASRRDIPCATMRLSSLWHKECAFICCYSLIYMKVTKTYRLRVTQGTESVHHCFYGCAKSRAKPVSHSITSESRSCSFSVIDFWKHSHKVQKSEHHRLLKGSIKKKKKHNFAVLSF